MAKKWLALFVLALFCLTLFSCGKDEADYVVDAIESVSNVFTESKLAKIFNSETTGIRISASVDTLKGLEEYADLAGDIEVPDVKDAKADFYIDLDKAQLAQVITATVDGEKMDFTATANLENAAVKSSLLKETYGVETDELLEWIMGSDDALSMAEEAFPALVNYIKASNDFAKDYKEALKDSFRDNLDIEKEKNGKFLEFKFDVSKKEAGRILDDVADFISDNEALDDLVDALGSDLGDLTDNLEYAIDNEESEGKIKVKLTVLKSSSKLCGMEMTLPTGTEIEFEADEKGDNFNFEIKDGEISITVSHKDGKYELVSEVEYASNSENYHKSKNAISLEFADGDVIFETSNEYENSYYGEVSHDKQKHSVTLGYKIKGDTIVLTLKGIGVNGINVKNIDKKVGFTIEIEKNPTLPKMIKKFEEIDNVEDFNKKVVDPITDELEDMLPARHGQATY